METWQEVEINIQVQVLFTDLYQPIFLSANFLSQENVTWLLMSSLLLELCRLDSDSTSVLFLINLRRFSAAVLLACFFDFPTPVLMLRTSDVRLTHKYTSKDKSFTCPKLTNSNALYCQRGNVLYKQVIKHSCALSLGLFLYISLNMPQKPISIPLVSHYIFQA